MLRAICPFSLSLTYVPAKSLLLESKIERSQTLNDDWHSRILDSGFLFADAIEAEEMPHIGWLFHLSCLAAENVLLRIGPIGISTEEGSEKTEYAFCNFFFWGGNFPILAMLLYVMFDAYWLVVWNDVVEILKQLQDIFLAEMHVHDWNLKGIFVTRSSILEQYSTCIT